MGPIKIDQRARDILSKFIKNCDSLDDAFNKVEKPVKGELNEFTAKGLKGYMAYGNGEISIYVDNEEQPWHVYVDNYGFNKIFSWG